MPFYTEKLHLKFIQPNDYFADESFNNILQDADDKLVGVAHLLSGAHWDVWERETSYDVNDIVRWPNLHGHQYAKCVVAGSSGTTMPNNNLTGGMVTDNTVTWEIVSLSEIPDGGGSILIWLSNKFYNRGDVVYYGKSLYRCAVAHTSTTFASDVGNWQEIFSSIRPWNEGIYYDKDDTVIIEGEIYQCTIAHTSGSTFNTTEASNWSLVGVFGLVRDWESNKHYHIGQLVDYSGITCVCTTEHISDDSDFSSDITKWKLFTAGISPWGLSDYYPLGSVVVYGYRIWRCIYAHNRTTSVFEDTLSNWTPLGYNLPAYLRDWQPNTYYYLHQTVLRENKYLYKCTYTHTSTNVWEDDVTNWVRLGSIEGVIRDWEPDIRYYPNQLVTYLGTLYRAVVLHDSDSVAFENDVSKWRRINANIGYWESSKYYPQYHLVEHNNTLYRCSVAHTSTSTFDITKWKPFLAYSLIESWQPDTTYITGQLVLNAGNLYIANQDHTSDSTSILTDMANWDLVYAGIGLWASATNYKVGQLVINDNKLYRCTTNHLSTSAFDDTKWQLIGGGGGAIIGDWQANTAYKTGQLVLSGNSLFRANQDHTSNISIDVDASKWDVVYASIINWTSSTYYKLGQFVFYNNKLYRCTTSHTSSSTFDPTKFEFVNANIVNWQASTEYIVGNLVVYNNQLYKCLTAHTSTSTFEVDGAKWQPIANNIAGIPAWASGIYYYENQVVKYNGKIWRCLTAHTSGVNDSPDNVIVYEKNQSHFFEVNMGTPLPAEYILDIGSVNPITKIRLNGGNSGIDIYGKIYISIDGTNYIDVGDFSAGNHSGSGPTINLYANARYIKIQVTSRFDGYGHGGYVYFSQAVVNGLSTKWEIIVDDGATITYWEQGQNYDVNDIVIYNDELYRCIEKHASGSTFDITKWTKISETSVHDWVTNKSYKVDNVVWYDNSVWRCLTNHTSDNTENPYEKEAYVASGNTVDIDDTTIMPYNEVIDLSSVQTITNITYSEVKTQMDAVYKIEVSSDNVTYTEWEGEEISARYVKITIESVSIDAGATAPNFYLDDFTVYTKSTKWQEISTMNTLTDNEIDEMFM